MHDDCIRMRPAAYPTRVNGSGSATGQVFFAALPRALAGSRAGGDDAPSGILPHDLRVRALLRTLRARLRLLVFGSIVPLAVLSGLTSYLLYRAHSTASEARLLQL